MTTTAMRIHTEDESRLLSLYIDDSPEQTAALLKTQALQALGIMDIKPNPEPLIALHDWIAAGPTQVTAPFFLSLAEQVDPSNGRMKRDFPKVLELVKARSLLHQATRQTEKDGRVIATLADYEAVYDLLRAPLAEGQAETLDEGVNEVVSAVSVLSADPGFRDGVPQTAIVEYLGKGGPEKRVHKSTVSRRVNKARTQGYLTELENKRGVEQALRVAKPRGKVRQALPHPSKLRGDKAS